MLPVRHSAFHMLLLSIGIAANGGLDAASSAPKAVAFAIPGWSETIAYESPLLSAQAACLTPDGNLLVYARSGRRLVLVAPDGTMRGYADCGGIIVRAIEWQDAMQRFLIIDQASGSLYELKAGTFRKLRTFGAGEYPSTIAVDAKGNIYGANEGKGTSLNLFAPDGRFVKRLVSGIQGCFRILADRAGSTVYFSETFTGRVSALDTATLSVRILGEGFGILGTAEAIPLAFDGGGRLLVCDLSRGIMRFDGARFAFVQATGTGAGEYLWWKDADALAQLHYAGSNIVLHDINDNRRADLTPHLNSTAIAALENGTVYLAKDQDLVIIDPKGGMERKASFFSESVHHLECDAHGNLYAGDVAGRIMRIHADGTTEVFADASTVARGSISSLSYSDARKGFVVVVSEYAAPRANILFLDGDGKWHLLLSMDEIATSPTLPRACAGPKGEVYVLERRGNTLYLLPKGASSMVPIVRGILPSDSVTVPSMEYSDAANGLIIGDTENYLFIDGKSLSVSTLGINANGADNFGLNQTYDKRIIAVHAGQVFYMNPP